MRIGFTTWIRALVVSMLVSALLPLAATAREVLYWTDNSDGAIVRAEKDGSDVETLLTGLTAPFGIDVDSENGHIYWVDIIDDTIYRANLDGSGIASLVETDESTYGLALDLVNGKIYWSSRGSVDGITRANLNGSEVEFVVSTGEFLTDLAVDPAAGKIYLLGNGEILRFNLNGTGQETLVDIGSSGLGQIDLDLAGGKMYWSNSGGLPRSIWRANLDGSSPEMISESGGSSPTGIAVDATAGKVYWTDSSSSRNGLLQRANLNGSGIETQVSGLAGPNLLALPEPNGVVSVLAAFGTLIALRAHRTASDASGTCCRFAPGGTSIHG